jgi:hypothetical protein
MEIRHFHVVKKCFFESLKKIPKQVESFQIKQGIKNPAIIKADISVNLETRDTKMKESRINKYFRSDIKKYDGRLN